MLSEAEFAEYVSSYDKLIENEKKKNLQKKNLKVVGGTDTESMKHKAIFNSQNIIGMLKFRIICHHRPPWASHLPSFRGKHGFLWEAGKPEAVKFQFQSKTLIIPQNGYKFSIYKSMRLLVPLELKATNVQKRTLAVINRVPGGTRPSHRASDFRPKLQGSKTDKSRSGSVSQKSGCMTQ